MKLDIEDLDDIVEEINNKPRKVLEYCKPVELMEKEMLKYQGVRLAM